MYEPEVVLVMEVEARRYPAELLEPREQPRDLPPRAAPEYPEDAVHHFARVFPRPAPIVLTARRLRNERLDNCPLFFS